AVLRFTSGAHGTVMIGWSLPKETPGHGIGGVTVIGERGLVRISQGDIGILQVDDSGSRDLDVYYAPEVHGRLRGALAIEADHFIACSRATAEPVCSAGDGVEAVRASLAIENSARTRAPVSLLM